MRRTRLVYDPDVPYRAAGLLHEEAAAAATLCAAFILAAMPRRFRASCERPPIAIPNSALRLSG